MSARQIHTVNVQVTSTYTYEIDDTDDAREAKERALDRHSALTASERPAPVVRVETFWQTCRWEGE